MKLASIATQSSIDGSPIISVPPGTYWVQLGDETLVFCSNANWDKVAAAASRAYAELQVHESQVRKQDLHLVVQAGVSFQQRHPEVPVILDKGRFLVVELAPQLAHEIGTPAEASYAVRPLEENTVVFDVARLDRAARAPVSWVQSVVDLVSRTSYEASLRQIVSYRTRHSLSPEFQNAAAWAQGQLTNLGYTTRLETITVGSSGATSRNVIADKIGAGLGGRDLILITAHLDSVNTAGGPTAPAPGADDNGSGCAGLLEIAKVLKNHPSTHDMRLILFGGEEQGLHGSTQYVASLTANDRARIMAIVNMDMIGSLNTAVPTVLLEGGGISQPTIDDLAMAAANYTTLNVQVSLQPFASDHVPFINAGLPAVLTIEGADSANMADHTANDTIDRIDFNQALEIVKMNVAFAVNKIGRAGGPVVPEGYISISDLQSFINNEGQTFVPVPEFVLLFRYSGRYIYNGGVASRTADANVSASVRSNPLYNLKEPIYITSADTNYSNLIEPLLIDLNWLWEPRITLSIDIDGDDPLHIVSGAVTSGYFVVGTLPAGFIGKITSQTIIPGGVTLAVSDFIYPWPRSTNTIDRLEITMTRSGFLQPVTAAATFVDSARGQRFGPYTLTQESPFFRDVEVEVDVEDQAINIQSYRTHSHPDRPANLAQEELTLETAFAKAGVHITRSRDSSTIIPTNEAGVDARWTEQELHDSMALHWEAFANTPQWKMWIFLAQLGESDGTGGIMFDGDIDEPGGVDRQGTAIFTRSPFYHTQAGAYIAANPPTAPAVERELFFNLMHETGHAFNLYHTHHKLAGRPWTPPSWMPLSPQNSWMSYPEVQSNSSSYNATAFYRSFHWRFDDGELLFLRHGPGSFVKMGAEAWGENHGRVVRETLDPRLRLDVLSTNSALELGQPVFIELRLSNIGNETATVLGNLDVSGGNVEVAVTGPRGKRLPFLSVSARREQIGRADLKPGESIQQSINLTMGKLGFAFKEPGFYRIEASFTNLDGRTAAAISQVYVRQPSSVEDMRAVSELFNARVGRVLNVGGTRVMEDVNETLDWVLNRIGHDHPAALHLTAVRWSPVAHSHKVVPPENRQVRLIHADPERAVRELQPVIERAAAAATAMGPTQYQQVVNTYADAALRSNERSLARAALEELVGLMESRDVSPSAKTAAEERLRTLQ